MVKKNPPFAPPRLPIATFGAKISHMPPPFRMPRFWRISGEQVQKDGRRSLVEGVNAIYISTCYTILEGVDEIIFILMNV